MHLSVIQYNSSEYISMCKLRDDILRKPIGLPLTKEELARDADDTLIGCMKDGEVIACCILTRIDSVTTQLRQMAVNANCQSKGTGKSLLDYAEQIAKENGYSTIMMHARKVATGFYQKAGYSITSEEFTEVGIPHFEMKKTI